MPGSPIQIAESKSRRSSTPKRAKSEALTYREGKACGASGYEECSNA
jgi:hypothetical protein